MGTVTFASQIENIQSPIMAYGFDLNLPLRELIVKVHQNAGLTHVNFDVTYMVPETRSSIKGMLDEIRKGLPECLICSWYDSTPKQVMFDSYPNLKYKGFSLASSLDPEALTVLVKFSADLEGFQ